jgi:hypothetical protein
MLARDLPQPSGYDVEGIAGGPVRASSGCLVRRAYCKRTATSAPRTDGKGRFFL